MLSSWKRNPLWIGFCLALAYFAIGLLALQLAIPPGYASPVWPPAGIALVTLLVYGRHLWPGVFLGAFALGIKLGHGSPTEIACVATGIAVGTAVQALVGASLVRRYVGFPDPLSEEGQILRFFTLAGPVACVVSASFGVLTLVLSGEIGWTSAAFSWWTWWAGDTLGVLTVAPLMLIALARPRNVWRQRKVSVAAPLCATLVAAVMVFSLERRFEDDRLRLDLEKRATRISRSLQTAGYEYLEILYAVDGLHRSFSEVDRQSFGSFLHAMEERTPGIRAVEWIPRVSRHERWRYEEMARADGLADFHIREHNLAGELVPAQLRDEYYPVYFVEPMAGNQAALGFDLASNPARHRAMIQARDTGQPVATEIVSLVQDDAEKPGFLIFFPVYADHQENMSLESRRQRLKGYALGVFLIEDMMAAAVDPRDAEGLALALVDDTNGAQELAYERLPDDDTRFTTQVAQSLSLASRRWEIQLTPSVAYLTTHQTPYAWVILGGGCLFSGLLAVLLLMVSGRAAVVEEMVGERTLALRHANSILQREVVQRQRAESELRRAGYALEAKAKDLERSNAELEQFAYVASHDLREPLRMISSYTQLLSERYQGQLDPDADRYIHYASDGAQRMNSLIGDLLAYSRLHKAEERLETVGLTEVVREAGSRLKLAIDESGAEIQAGRLPRVRVDPTQFTQLFQNLIGNAIKFRGDEAPRIEISAEEKDDEWILSVSDNGIGIAPEYRDRIFVIFQRLHTKEKFPGTGIGLAICKRIVEQHGGRIWVETAPSEGTCFRFSIPKQSEEPHCHEAEGVEA